MQNFCDIKQVVDLLNMQPSKTSQHELRFGKRGSLSVDLKNNVWFDHEHMVGGGILDLVVHHGSAHDKKSAAKFLSENGLIANTDGAPRAQAVLRSHIYRNERGEPIRKATKYQDGRWRQHGCFDGDWKPTVKGLPNIPYQLEELFSDHSDRLVFIFEGEKDVDRALAYDLLATCNAAGAGNWKPELNKHLMNRTVCIVPDNDTAGLDHADKVLGCLMADGIDAFIMTSHLPILPAKGDFSDWMDLQGDNINAFLELVQRDRASQKSPDQAYLEQFGIKPASALMDMEFGELKFCYPDIIPSEGLSLLAALPKTGKSWLALNFAKYMDTNGVSVHYLAAEDNERRLKSRVAAVFPDGVHHLTYHAVMSSQRPLPRGSEALQHIEKVARATGAKCIIVDTVQAILNPSVTNKNYDVTVEEYDALRKLAHKLGIAIIVVHHCKKTTDISSAPLEKVIGSVGITGTAETILVMEQLTGTQDCKLTVTGKDVEQTEKHLAWNGHGFDISDDVREAKLGATQKLVLELIREHPRCTQKYIVDTIGKDQGQVAKAINRLIELGLVVKKGVQLSAQ
jgi:hypothetical protein